MKFLLSLFDMLLVTIFSNRGSVQVTTAMVDMFSANAMHLSQQEGSVLYGYTRQETQDSESKFWDRIGLRETRRKEGRHSDVVYDDTPHSRRMVTMEDFYSADLVDQEDKIRTIMNIDSEYVVAMGMAFGRRYDEEIITAALGNAYEGKKGTTVTALPNSQKVACFDPAITTTVGLGLNIPTLRAVRKKFKQNESIKKGEKIILAVAAQQIDDLLGTTAVTSADYNTVKALVDGEVDTFMGFKFVETELLPFLAGDATYTITTGVVGAGTGTVTAAEGRRCIAFTNKRGVLFAKGREVKGKITEMPGKHYSHQVYGALTVGGTRMEEEQVVEVICKEV